jgi:Holliday junction DNA helicase RuvB
VIDCALVVRSLEDMGIDAAGLDEVDRRVLKTVIEVYDGGPVGVEALAASLNEEVDTIVDTVEPYLLKAGFLKRTARGRAVTKRAYEHFHSTRKGDTQRKLWQE